MKNELLWYWFVNIPRIGLKTREQLLSVYSHPSEIWNSSSDTLKHYLTKQQLDLLEGSKKPDILRKNYHIMLSANIQFLSCQHPDFPFKLSQIPRSPHGIYLKGKLPPTNSPLVAVVGSRSPSPYGMEIAKWYLHELTSAGVNIISGLAAGIDTMAHEIALQNQQYTIGILGGGIDTMYPRDNFNLYLNMYDRGGVLSEYNMGVPNASGLFPERNRIISGLSDAVLIIEAAEKSGTLITADHALEQGKDIYVIPGRVTDTMSKGCNHLIHQGACLTESPQDLLSDLSMTFTLQHRKSNAETNQITDFEDPLEECIYFCLDDAIPLSVNDLLYTINHKNKTPIPSSSVTISELLQKLMMMEIKKSVTQMGNGQYVRKRIYHSR